MSGYTRKPEKVMYLLLSAVSAIAIMVVAEQLDGITAPQRQHHPLALHLEAPLSQIMAGTLSRFFITLTNSILCGSLTSMKEKK
ncbi:hypothetical protein H671_5g14301 [Cricetulus griseus]|nr:hypothetical protein H671_5g14301 [Cricetulus griseus]